MATIRIHADDWGLTHGINSSILSCIQSGLLHSASIIPNGYAFEEAIADYHAHEIAIQIHLNFIEGYSLASQTKDSFLCSPFAQFDNSFMSLYWQTLKASSVEQNQMKKVIKAEMKAQIEKVKPFLKDNARLNVDSHQHIHMIPLFFDTLCELVEELSIQYIRIPAEELSFLQFFSIFPQSMIGTGWIKVALLNYLSKYAHKRIRSTKAVSNRGFIGVMGTGKMNIDIISRMYAWMQTDFNTDDEVEILLHPGKAKSSEQAYWDAYPSLKKYYLSHDRDMEAATIKSDSLSAWYKSISMK